MHHRRFPTTLRHVQGFRPLWVGASLVLFGCAQRGTAPSSSPSSAIPISAAVSAPPPASAPLPSAKPPAPQTTTLEVRIPASLDPSWLGNTGHVTTRRAGSEPAQLGELYDDPRARAAYARQQPGVTISGQPNALSLLARFSAWSQGGEFAEPPLTSVRVASLQGLDAEQARAIVRLFVETHMHEVELWLADPTSLAAALGAAQFVIDDPRGRADCHAPCVPWAWQTRWSVLELAGRAAWREGDNTHDAALLDAAIAHVREAVRAVPDAAHPLTAAVTERLLGAALDSRAELDPQRRGIDDALAASRRALAAFAAPEARVDRAITNHNIQEQLRELGERDVSAARYDEALALSSLVQQGLDAREAPLAQARSVLLQAELLQDRYDSLDDRASLAAARDQVLRALPLVAPGASPLLEQRLYGVWCSVSSELGSQTGDLAELEKGAQACERALALAPDVKKPRATLSVSYGLALCRLGEARSDVPLLRRAVAQIRDGIAGLDVRALPSSRAKALNNLGVALLALSRREQQKENLTLSDAAFEQAVTLLPKRNDPVRWAKDTLGRAETERRLGWMERSSLHMDAAKEHYEKALRAIDDALTVLTPKNQATLWASAQERAGDVLAREGEIAEGYHFPQAVMRYQLALRVNRRATDPAAYAQTQFGLGVAYLFWADQSSGIEHIRGIAKKSVAAFREALAVRAQLGLVHTLPDTKAHLADALEILDRVSYRVTCDPARLFKEAVQQDPKAMGLWESAANAVERYRKANDAFKCSL